MYMSYTLHSDGTVPVPYVLLCVVFSVDASPYRGGMARLSFVKVRDIEYRINNINQPLFFSTISSG